jgi:peptidoglycan hydrolase-like protein with peptidoglycan-binding domain
MTVTITASVGVGGANRMADVKAIQQALNDLPPGAGGPDPKLAVDGIAGPKTNAAILNFQKANLGLTQDGRIDPTGSTLRMLNARLDASAMAHDPKALALQATIVSNSWASFALTAINGPLVGNTRTAADIHFHLNAGTQPEATYLNIIRTNYMRVMGVFQRAAQIYRSRNDAEAASDRGVDDEGVPFPAYTFFNASINFTREFKPFDGSTGFGPMCLAAMVLHEPVHYVDRLASPSNDFYEHGPEYASLTTEQAVHNPSSYVCFAQQIVFGSGVRFGAGKPQF